jgi:hypothetical protein
MRRFFNWLTNRNKSPQKRSEMPPWTAKLSPVERDKANPKRGPVEPVIYSDDTGGRIEDGGPGKNVLIRNKYVREDTGTHETLKIFSASAIDLDEDGQDPYNSGRFDRSKSWGSNRSHK